MSHICKNKETRQTKIKLNVKIVICSDSCSASTLATSRVEALISSQRKYGNIDGTGPRGQSSKWRYDQVAETLVVALKGDLDLVEDRGQLRKTVKGVLARVHGPQYPATDDKEEYDTPIALLMVTIKFSSAQLLGHDVRSLPSYWRFC